jgi:hypothetical protein
LKGFSGAGYILAALMAVEKAEKSGERSTIKELGRVVP